MRVQINPFVLAAEPSDPFCLCCIRILQKAELAPHISMDELGRLLPEEALAPLEEQYLSKQQVAPASSSLWSLRFWDDFKRSSFQPACRMT